MTPPGVGRLQHPPAGIVSLVMGIVGLVALPLIGSIIGLIFGYQSRSVVAREPHVYSDDLGRVGRILSWIGIALYGVGLVFVLLIIALITVAGAAGTF